MDVMEGGRRPDGGRVPACPGCGGGVGRGKRGGGVVKWVEVGWKVGALRGVEKGGAGGVGKGQKGGGGVRTK